MRFSSMQQIRLFNNMRKARFVSTYLQRKGDSWNIQLRLYQHQYDEKEILSEEEEMKPEDALKTAVSTEKDKEIPNSQKVSDDDFENNETTKSSQDEKTEETFKIDYGNLQKFGRRPSLRRANFCLQNCAVIDINLFSDGLVDLAQRESVSSMQSNTSDDNLSWLLNYKITNV